MRYARSGISAILVGVAATLLVLAIGSWWASLLTIRVAGTLSSAARSVDSSQVVDEITQAAGANGVLATQPGAAGAAQTSQLNADIQQLLADPTVSQALASSPQAGTKLLSKDLAKLGQPLGSLAQAPGFVVNAGDHELARTSKGLKLWSKRAIWIAIAVACTALLLSPARARTARRLALSGAGIAVVVLAASWVLPRVLKSFLHGAVLSNLSYIVSGGSPVTRVAGELLVGALLVAVGTLVFELVGGHKVSTSPQNSQVPRSWTA